MTAFTDDDVDRLLAVAPGQSREYAATLLAAVAPAIAARATEVIDGYVWCDEHGSIHDDTTDPFNDGYATCLPRLHSPVLRARAEQVSGDE